MALMLLTQVADEFQANKDTDVTISVRSNSGAVTLASASYPDGGPILPLNGGNATFKVQAGEHVLSVSVTPTYPWELWWVVEVDCGTDSPALDYASGFAGGAFNLTIKIKGV
jgi:hypothetical protein